MKIPVNEVTDWSKVTPNFDILETPDGIKGKLAGFDQDGRPHIVWAKDGIGFNDLSSQVKLMQQRHNLEKTLMNDAAPDFDLDLPAAKPKGEVAEFNAKTTAQPKADTDKAKPGRKKDPHKVSYKLDVPDVAKQEPNKYVQSTCTITVTEADTDKAVTSKEFRMLRCGVPGLTELAFLGLQTVLNRITRRKAPDERVKIIESLLERLEANDVGVLYRKQRKPARKAPMISIEVQAIAMARGWAIPPVAENWAKASETQREAILKQPDIAAKLAELREAQGGTEGMDDLFG